MADAAKIEAPTPKTIKSDFDHLKSGADVEKTYEHISSMLYAPGQSNATRLSELHSLNADVSLKKLGLSGFKIMDFDPKFQNENGKGALIVADQQHHKHAIDAKGNELSMEHDKIGKKEKDSVLPERAPNNVPNQSDSAHAATPFGKHGRKMEIGKDGKSEEYHVNKGDSLWKIEADLLGKNKKHLSARDKSEIWKGAKKLASQNHLHDWNHIKPGESLTMPPAQAEAAKKREAEKHQPEHAAKLRKPEKPGEKSGEQKGEKPGEKPGENPSQKPVLKPGEAPAQTPPKATTELPSPEKSPTDTTQTTPKIFHPDDTDAKLQPHDGIYNPLMPKGLVEGTPETPVTDTTDGVANRDVADDPNDPEKVKSITGKFDDGFLGFFRSTFTDKDELDAQGGLLHRKLDYTGDVSMEFRDQTGSIFEVNKVDSIETTRQQDGTYKTLIRSKMQPADSSPLSLVTDSDGVVKAVTH